MHFDGELALHLDELAPGVRQAVRQQGVHLAILPDQVGREAIAHLDGPGQVLRPEFQEGLQVLPGMAHAGEKQGDPVGAPVRQQGGGLDGLAALLALAGDLLQDPHGGVIVVQEFALRGLTNQFGMGRLEQTGSPEHQFPLGRNRQGNAENLLQALDAVVRQAGAVAKLTDQGGHAGIVFRRTGARRRRCGESLLAAVTAAPAFQLIDRGLKRRHALHPDQSGRLRQGIDLAVAVRRGARVAAVKALQRHLHPLGTLIGRRSVATMAGGDCIRILGLAPGRGLATQHRGGAFRPGPEQDELQLGQGNLPPLHLLAQESQGVHRLLQIPEGVFSQGLFAGPLQVPQKGRHVQFSMLEIRS